MSTTDLAEPSTFALDVYFAAGAQGDAKLAEHIAGCARCTAYLQQLAALAEKSAPLPPATARSTRRPAWIAAGAFVSACAAVALFLNAGDNYVGSKGLPGVQALIRSAGQANVWDGKSPLRSGDAIALRTDCDHFSHVAVAVPAAQGGKPKHWKLVFAGSCKEHEPLPFTLVTDDSPGEEQIEIVFSRAALPDAALQQAIAGRKRSDTTWVITLLLPKAGVAR